MRLILASASPRRAELLRAAGYHFEAWPVEVDERIGPEERAEQYVVRLALEKSARALERWRTLEPGAPESPIFLGADTSVVVDDEILGKPIDAADAARMIRRLAGRSHQVLTGVSLRRNEAEAHAVETTHVWFGSMTVEEIEWYVATGEGLDKAGAYAIQGVAARFIPKIEGSYANVVGLPISLIGWLTRELDGNVRLASSRY